MKPGTRLWPFGPLLLAVILAFGARFLMLRVVQPSGPGWEWYNLGVEASRKGDLPGAIIDLQRATGLNNKLASAIDLLAGCYLRTGNTELALETLQQLEALDPDQSYVSTRIAETYAGIDNALTERWATLAVLQDPRSPRAHMLMALALARDGSTLDAVSHALIAEKLTNDDALKLLLKQDPSLRTDPAREAILFQNLATRVSYQ